MKKGKEWVRHPAANVKMLLQSKEHEKTEAEAIMGSGRGAWLAAGQPALPRRYPGGRQWNFDAAQFKFKPAELADDEVPHHPHWDMIFEHIGRELTPALRELPWAIAANIRTGADIFAPGWPAPSAIPSSPLPYLFFFGPEDSGKSIFYESLAASDEGRGPRQAGAHQRIQLRVGRCDHLRSGRGGHHQVTRCPRQDSKNTAPGEPS